VPQEPLRHPPELLGPQQARPVLQVQIQQVPVQTQPARALLLLVPLLPVLLLLALLPTSLPPLRHLQQEPFCRLSQEPKCQRVRTFLQESPRWWPFRQHPSSNPLPWLLPLRLSGHFRPH
jgi:hypothetical protein